MVDTSTVSAVKPGIKTTEFVLVMFVKLITLGMTFAGMIPPALLAIIWAVIVSVYTICRTIVKNGDPAYTVPDLPAAPAGV